MSYGYQNLGGHSQSNLVPGGGGSNNAASTAGGFADPADAENQYEDYYSHPQAGGALNPPQYPSYGGNSPQQPGSLEPPYMHPGYTHNQSYASNYGSNSQVNLRQDSVSPLHTGSPAPTYGNLPASDSGRDILQPVGPRIMGAGSNDEPNVAPHQAVHWVSADQHGRLGVPGVNDGNNNSMYPSYSGDTFTSNVNPFDAPMDQPPAHPHEDIPLLDQHGRQGSGYSQVMLPGAMPMGPGGFMDPNMMHDDDDELSQVRYGRIPQRVPRRLKTIKQVSLFRGNLVLDVPVPKSLLAACPLKEDREFTRMRYTAATCDPDHFMDERYSLRQQLMSPPRQVELMIVMTMYNEDDNLYTRTMYGVQKNIQHLCSRNKSRMWGKDAWKKVVVVIVSDGRKKVNSRTLSVLATQGVYQDGVAKNVVNGKPVTCHIYEYTTQIAVTPDLKYKGAESGIVPVQIIFALKEQNQKKINSHRWFFNAFARCLNPNVCVLLDVGTRPGPTSIYHLWKAFDKNSNVGGACGEIVTLKGKYMSSLLNPLVAAQNFEYKMSNILDKPLESVFGYITVLPGAFSAYRWHALQNDSVGNGPLKEYFKGETLESAVDADLLTKNMYLAEDRVLCWELVSKRQSRWILHYVKSAYGITDTPDSVPELISQRRRWLNGSFFAAIHATVKFGYIYRSDHSFIRKFWLHIELVYQLFQQLFAWFSLANYYISFSILTHSLEDASFGLGWTKYVNIVLHYIYLGLLIMCFLLSMGNTPKGSKKMYLFAMIMFAIITAYMIFAAFFITVKGIINAKNAIEATGGTLSISDIFTNPIFRSIVISLMATYGCWIFASLIFLDPWHLLTSFVQYLLLAPSYINVINTYAFCNTHDVSWGTKGSTTVATDLGVVKTSGDDKVDIDIPADEKDIEAAFEDAKAVLASKPATVVAKVDPHQKMEDSYKNIRTNVVLIWTITNGALVAGIIGSGASASFAADGSSAKVNIYMTILLIAIAVLAFIKTVGATIYMVFWMFQG